MENKFKQMRIAIIGFGGMATWHFHNMKKSGLFHVTGVYDIDPKRNEAAVKLGVCAYADVEALIAEPGLDAVLIATPNDVHASYAVKILEHGIAVLCEKPVTLSSDSLQTMLDAAKNGNTLLMVHQNRRWDKDFLIIRSIYDSGLMGGLYKVDSNVTGSHGLPGSWRRVKAKGGGMLWDWGVHLIDQMLTMNVSPVIGVTCKASYVYGYDCDDGIYLTLEFADGFVANINLDTNKFVKTPRWYAYGLDGTAVVNGWNCQGKMIQVKTFDDSKNKGITAGNGFTKTMADRSRGTVIKKRLPKVKIKKFEFYQNFYDCIFRQAKPIVDNASIMRCMKVMEAGFQSIEEKRTIVTDI